jgi:acetyl-CoA acetyltransferase
MDVYILGFSVHPPAQRVGDKRLEEMVFDTSAAALARAAVERAEVDHITLATCDELDGRPISSMLLACPAGGYLKDELKVTDSGLIGLCLAALRIASGWLHLGILASWNKTSIGPFEDVMRMRCEPFYTRPIGLNASIADGLFAQTMVAKGIATPESADSAAERLMQRAAQNPRGLGRKPLDAAAVSASPYVSVPLREAHRAPLTDGAVTMVLCSERWLSEHPAAQPLARIAGLGWAVDRHDLGGARLGEMNSFKSSWSDALNEADLDSASALDVVEFDCQTAFHALAYEEVLGLAGSSSINPSGSAFAQNPYFCTGLINLIEAIHQVTGLAGPVQVEGARRAAAHGQHGFALQGNAVVLIERV